MVGGVLVRLPWWTISVLVHAWVFLLLAQSEGCVSALHEPRAAEVSLFEGTIAPRPPGPRPGEGAAQRPAMPVVETLPQAPILDAARDRPVPSPAAAGPVDLSDLLALAAPAGTTLNLLGPRLGPGGRADALQLYGGSGGSERAVDRGLKWLADHQDRTGRWSRLGYTAHCPRGDVCDHRVSTLVDLDLDVGVTSLALLAFLGRGHTHHGDGPYRDAVGRAVEFLLRSQANSGLYGPPHRYHMYNHGLATLALAEAAALSGDEQLKDSVTRAVQYLADAQQAGGGWDYSSAKTGRNDTSVTGWQVLALKSAAQAGVAVPWQVTAGAIACFRRQTASTGDVAYADLGAGAGRQSTSMIAVGMVSRQFLGWHRSSPDLVIQAERLLRELPDWERMSDGELHSEYYWYYGTLGMFQMGGRYWDQWNARLRDLLVGRQTGFGHRTGSWEPVGRWAKTGGRVYMTALNILNLEIYYRYLPLYRLEGGALGAGALRQAYRQTEDANERAAIVHDLGQMQDRDAEAAVTAALDDASMAVRFEAGAILARRGREAGRQVLADAAQHTSSFIRARALEVLATLDEMWVVPILIDRLTDQEPTIANSAASRLYALTGKRFPFDPQAGVADRAAAVVAWQAWWRDYQAQHPSTRAYRQLGTILAARAGTDAVVVGLHGDATLEVGQLVWVYRGGQWVATVRVTEVLPQMAAGVVVSAAPGKACQPNDTVSNRPGGPPTSQPAPLEAAPGT